MSIIITPFFNQWLLKMENSIECINVFKRKEDAIVEGSALAQRTKTELTIFNHDSVVESTISYKEEELI